MPGATPDLPAGFDRQRPHGYIEAGADPSELQDQFFGLCENLNLDGMRRMVAIGLDPNRAVNDGWNCDVLHGCLQTYTRKPAAHLHACINLLIDAGATE